MSGSILVIYTQPNGQTNYMRLRHIQSSTNTVYDTYGGVATTVVEFSGELEKMILTGQKGGGDSLV